MERVEELLFASARRTPDHIALVCSDRRLTYRQLVEQVDALAAALHRRGIRRGDRVVLVMPNSIELAIAFWAVLHAGAVAVPINAGTKSEKLSWLLHHSGAAALLVEARLAPGSVPGDVHTVIGTDQLPQLLAAAPPVSSLEIEKSTSDLATLIYTSGSTGQPKGVMLTHHNMVSAAVSIGAYLGTRDDDIIHGIMPMSFDYGLYQLILSAQAGATLVIASSFLLPTKVLEQTAAERVTFFPAVPTVFGMIAQLPARVLSNVRAVTSTAAALTEQHTAVIRRVFPNARIFSMYGVTECKRCTYLPPEDLERKPGSVGIAIPGTELWLVDENDRRVGAGHVGQLVIRGPTVMEGYWREPTETARVVRAGRTPDERILYTGDLCRLDEDGYVYFVGRMDDIIKSRGEKVAPKEVESVLASVPGVSEAAVIGVADELMGEAVTAFVAIDAAARVTETDLLRACRNKLESYMVPMSITLLPSLPKSANGKIDKLSLRALMNGARCTA